MEWNKLLFIIGGLYLAYFGVNLLIDMLSSKKEENKNEEALIQFTDVEEAPQTIAEFPNIEEEEPAEVVPINSEVSETKKKQEHEEIKDEETDTETVGFQSLPVDDFLKKAKDFSSMVDFA